MVEKLDKREELGKEVVNGSDVGVIKSDKDYKGDTDLYLLFINKEDDIGLVKELVNKVKLSGQVMMFMPLKYLGDATDELMLTGFDYKRLLVNQYNRDKKDFGYYGDKVYMAWGINRGLKKNKGGWVFNKPEDLKFHTGFFNHPNLESLVKDVLELHTNKDSKVQTNNKEVFEIIEGVRNVELDDSETFYVGETILPISVENKEVRNDTYKNNIIQQDCFEYLQHIKDNSVDLVITDPPYNISIENSVNAYGGARTGMDFGAWDYGFQTDKWLHYIAPKVREGGQMLIFNSYKNIGIMMKVLEGYGYEVVGLPMWLKTNPIPHLTELTYVSSMEHALWVVRTNGKSLQELGVVFNGKPYVKKTKKKSDYNDGIILSSPHSKQGERFHTTQKPVWLFNKLIQNHSNAGDLVMDTFMGSVTTAVCSQGLNRNYLGCELDDEYFAKSTERLNKTKRKTKSIFK